MRATRILWVKVGGLWPLDRGGRLRSFHIVSELSQRHHVSVLTTHGPEENPGELQAKLPRCERVTSVPYAAPKRGSARFAAALARSWCSSLPVDLWKWRVPDLRRAAARMLSVRDFDLCVADFLVAVPNLPTPWPVPTVLFEHNVEHVIWKRLSRTAPPWQRPLLELEWRKVRRFEGRACRRAKLTVAVSDADRALVSALAPGAAVCAIPTGVDTAYFAPNGAREAPARLVFTGAMDWYPNEDAILYFIDAILPSIRREVPETSLTVVGRNPSARLRAAAAAAGVQVTGTVGDVRPYVDEAAVSVVPLRVGGGTRLKIFEGLAMAKAVVSTTVGSEGLPLVAGTHFLQADDPAEFARTVVSLLRDPARRQALGAAGRRLVVERYSWAHVARQFEARCEEALAASPRDSSRGGRRP
jgi:sugar transferase (PEP-CTERM/EpsH1 system associated)